ncbi:Outer capsid protein sigma-3, partial [Frankliniella fusca]
MSLSKPRLASVEFGVKRFLLNPEHFNEPCKLFDLMTEDVEICAAGVFVLLSLNSLQGELSHLPQHTSEAQLHQVNLIKSESPWRESPWRESTRAFYFSYALRS